MRYCGLRVRIEALTGDLRRVQSFWQNILRIEQVDQKTGNALLTLHVPGKWLNDEWYVVDMSGDCDQGVTFRGPATSKGRAFAVVSF